MPDTGRRSALRLHARDSEVASGSTSLLKKGARLSEPGSVRVSLSVRDGEASDEWKRASRGIPMLIHEQLDSGCVLLQDLLFGAERQGANGFARVRAGRDLTYLYLHSETCERRSTSCRAARSPRSSAVVARRAGEFLAVIWHCRRCLSEPSLANPCQNWSG
jgi:hypothetical protein